MARYGWGAPRSPCWLGVDVVDDGHVQCKYCGKHITRNATYIKRHLLRCDRSGDPPAEGLSHENVIRQINAFTARSTPKQKRPGSSVAGGRSKRLKQATLPAMIGATQASVDDLLMDWVAGAALPLATVEDPRFHKFVESLVNFKCGSSKPTPFV